MVMVAVVLAAKVDMVVEMVLVINEILTDIGIFRYFQYVWYFLVNGDGSRGFSG